MKTEYWNKKDSNQINQIKRDDEIETSEAGGTRKGKAGKIYRNTVNNKQETKNKKSRKRCKRGRKNQTAWRLQRYAAGCGNADRLSYKGHRADALAPGAEERRDKLRKAMGRGKYPLIHGCLNGETRMRNPHASAHEQCR